MDNFIRLFTKVLADRGLHGKYQLWDKLWRLTVVGRADTLIIDIRQGPETYEVIGYSANAVNAADWDTGKGLEDDFFSFTEDDKGELWDRLLKEIVSIIEEI